MRVSTMPGDYIIGMANEAFGKTETDFVIHGICIKNDSKEQARIQSLTIQVLDGDYLIKEIVYQKQGLLNLTKSFAEQCAWLGEGFGAKLFLGQEGFFNPESFSGTNLLNPGEETGLFNEYIIVVHHRVVNSVKVQVEYFQGEQAYTEEYRIPVIQYQNKNSYRFPLVGSISTCGNYNAHLDHRQHYSMEFAIDMARYNDDQMLFYKEDMTEEEHVVYGQDVLAIADGEVAECYNEYPVTSSWDWEERKPYFEQYGPLPSQCGNYVSIRHANGEYSFYGHMIFQSLTVKKGDSIRQGQVIGKVGHTGMSNCPHLHFQLMDGPDFATGRGLPCSFTNIMDVCGDRINVINDNNMIIHTLEK